MTGPRFGVDAHRRRDTRVGAAGPNCYIGESDPVRATPVGNGPYTEFLAVLLKAAIAILGGARGPNSRMAQVTGSATLWIHNLSGNESTVLHRCRRVRQCGLRTRN